MLGLVLTLALAQSEPTQHPYSPVIVTCDGKHRGHISGNAAGEPWFSVSGKLVDPNGSPICGALVSVQYLVEATDLSGSTSPTGLNGEYFLDNIRKDTPFRVVVNPYFNVEWKTLTTGLEAVPAYVEGRHNVRTGGLARYVSEELRMNQTEGVVTKDITLGSDLAATGIVMGETGVSGPHFAGTSAVLVIPGRFEADLHIDGKGAFVVFGVPPGNAEIRAEIHAGGRVHKFNQTVTVPPTKDTVTRVNLRLLE